MINIEKLYKLVEACDGKTAHISFLDKDGYIRTTISILISKMPLRKGCASTLDKNGKLTIDMKIILKLEACNDHTEDFTVKTVTHEGATV